MRKGDAGFISVYARFPVTVSNIKNISPSAVSGPLCSLRGGNRVEIVVVVVARSQLERSRFRSLQLAQPPRTTRYSSFITLFLSRNININVSHKSQSRSLEK